MSDLYIGLMSGTSADGIDAALVDFSSSHPALIATHYMPYSANVRQQVLALCQQGPNEIERLGELDILLAKLFAQTVNHLLASQSLTAQHIKAIGSHGQTIRHSPHSAHRFTLQITDPNTIATETNITTVADFRRKDMAYGGQGAPLVPAFHQYLFSSTHTHRAIVNIGGISNVTLLAQNNPEPIIGFDLGPGNVLLDAWIYKHLNKNHDDKGNWGAQGTIQIELLHRLLEDKFFHQAPPKSTGREYFNLDWLHSFLTRSYAAVDIQTTLVELTASSIVHTIKKYLPRGEILICGGGAHNQYLLSRLRELAQPHFIVESTAKWGIDPDWIEAMAFAWLARQTLAKQPGNIPTVTGAKQATILGGVYYA
jgi:anhydro-N-acetylmuramic acid kinase